MYACSAEAQFAAPSGLRIKVTQQYAPKQYTAWISFSRIEYEFSIEGACCFGFDGCMAF